MIQRADGKLAVALMSEVFWEPDGPIRLKQRLAEAADRGADVAILPELPLNPWSPATKQVREDDAEPMGGPRTTAQAEAAAEAGIGLIGGIIHRADDGRRTSRALVFDAAGQVVATLREAPPPRRGGLLGDEPLRARRRAPAANRRVRAAHRPAAVLGQQPARGHAPPRRTGGRRHHQPAGHRGGDVPALEDRLAGERHHELLLRRERQPAVPGAGRRSSAGRTW